MLLRDMTPKQRRELSLLELNDIYNTNKAKLRESVGASQEMVDLWLNENHIASFELERREKENELA